METTEMRKQVTLTEHIVDIICNKCGQHCFENYATLSAQWGYGSLKDLEFHKLHLCESYYDIFVATLKTPPKVIDQG